LNYTKEYVRAQNNLGHCYLNGFGVEKNVIKAVELFQKAAEQGNANAQYQLENYYNKQKY